MSTAIDTARYSFCVTWSARWSPTSSRQGKQCQTLYRPVTMCCLLTSETCECHDF